MLTVCGARFVRRTVIEGEMEEPMSEPPKEEGKSKSSRFAFAAIGGVSQIWLVLPFFILAQAPIPRGSMS